MTEDRRYDLVIIGGGPGGYPAAIRAAQLGAKVALVEKRALGGTCLNEGCIPTKALLRTAKILEDIRRSKEFGIAAAITGFDMKEAVARKDQVVERLGGGVRQLLEGNGVDVYDGMGTVETAHQVNVELGCGETIQLRCAKLLIAVGSVATIPPISGIDLPGVIGSREALDLEDLPDTMIVVGGNVIGLEFASIFTAFGVEVTVLGRNPKLLKYLDEEISRRIRPMLRKRGVNVITDAPVEGIEATESGSLRVTYTRRGKEMQETASIVLNAAGRKPDIDQLPLEALGITVKDGAIAVDEHMVTSNPDVLAIGDAIGGMMLAHVATAEGLCAVEGLYGEPRPLNPNALPDAAYTLPEAAGVGLTEADAKKEYPASKVAKFSYAALGKAVAIGETDGMVKIVYDGDSGRVLGMHIVGIEAPLLIHEGVLAIEAQMTVKELAASVHAHPTLAEAVMEAAHGAIGAPIHMLSR